MKSEFIKKICHPLIRSPLRQTESLDKLKDSQKEQPVGARERRTTAVLLGTSRKHLKFLLICTRGLRKFKLKKRLSLLSMLSLSTFNLFQSLSSNVPGGLLYLKFYSRPMKRFYKCSSYSTSLAQLDAYHAQPCWETEVTHKIQSSSLGRICNSFGRFYVGGTESVQSHQSSGAEGDNKYCGQKLKK